LRLNNLGLIVVDERYDLSYKQQEGSGYSARDYLLSFERSRDIPLILEAFSCTLRPYTSRKSGRYHHRPTSTCISHYHSLKCIELQAQGSEERSGSCKTIGQGQRVLVFINRRWICTGTYLQNCKWMKTNVKTCMSYDTASHSSKGFA
jgi:primosomal protein N' (replication factor Y)